MGNFIVSAEPPRHECGDCAHAVGVNPAFAGELYCALALTDAKVHEGVEGIGYVERALNYCEATRSLRGVGDGANDNELVIATEWARRNTVMIPPGSTFLHDVSLAAGILESHCTPDDPAKLFVQSGDLSFLVGRFSANPDAFEVAIERYVDAADIVMATHDAPVTSSIYQAARRGMANTVAAIIHLNVAQNKIDPKVALYDLLEVQTDIVEPYAEELAAAAKVREMAGYDWSDLLGAIGEVAAYVGLLTTVIENGKIGLDLPLFTPLMLDESGAPRIRRADGRVLGSSSDVGVQRGRIVPTDITDIQVKSHLRRRNYDPLYEDPIDVLTLFGSIEEFMTFIHHAIEAQICGNGEEILRNDPVLPQITDYNTLQWLHLPQY